VDIHQGGQTQIQFEFWGTPPFEFTYTRSSNAKKGHKSEVLETKHDISYEHQKIIPASEEGTYEVVAIKDSFCAFSTAQPEGRKGQKLLQY
jgi:nucleoporin POM152